MKTAVSMMAVWAALVGGCTAQSTGNGAGPGDDSAAAGGLSCSAIVDCATKCKDGDDACIDACISKGTPDGQAKAQALKTCIETNACADSSCLQSKCSAALTACVQATSASKGSSGGAAPAQGSVPSDLVG